MEDQPTLNPNPPATPAKKPVRFGLSIVIVVICFIAAGLAVYWILTEPVEQPLVNVVERKAADSTASWQTYRNEEFEVRHPKDWKIEDDFFYSPKMYQMKEGGPYSLSITTDPFGGQTITGFLNKNEDCVSDKATFIFDNKEFASFKDICEYERPTIIVMQLESDIVVGTSYSIDPKEIDTIKQILSTFKFIDMGSSFKTYRNDKYGFSMQYSSDMPELQVFENKTQTISYCAVCGFDSFELHFFDNSGQFSNFIYNADEDNTNDVLTYSKQKQEWVVTTVLDVLGNEACPQEKTTRQGTPIYYIATGHHAGDGFSMYITKNGLIAVVGVIPDDVIISFDNPALALKAGCQVVKK